MLTPKYYRLKKSCPAPIEAAAGCRVAARMQRPSLPVLRHPIHAWPPVRKWLKPLPALWVLRSKLSNRISPCRAVISGFRMRIRNMSITVWMTAAQWHCWAAARKSAPSAAWVWGPAPGPVRSMPFGWDQKVCRSWMSKSAQAAEPVNGCAPSTL